MSMSKSRKNYQSSVDSTPIIQQVLRACKTAFDDMSVPSQARSGAVSRLAELMDRITAADVGLNRLTHENGLRDIEFVEIADFLQFTVGIFLVPKGRKLPLHDHPGMTVMSKVLFGNIAITNFDKVEYGQEVSDGDYRAPLETVIKSNQRQVSYTHGCEILYPTSGGNIHEFLATEDAAVLDVLAPPYDCTCNRPCTYFRPVGVGAARPSPQPKVLREGKCAVDAQFEAESCAEENDPWNTGFMWPEIELVGVLEGETVWLLAQEAPTSFYTERREYTGTLLVHVVHTYFDV